MEQLAFFLPSARIPAQLFIEAEKDIRVVRGCKPMVAEGSSLHPKDNTSMANFPQVKNPNKTEKVEREHRPNHINSYLCVQSDEFPDSPGKVDEHRA